MPCGPSAEFGIVDYGHRPIPDIFLGSALATGGVWNSSNYANPEFDAQLSAYRTAVDVDGQKAAIGEIQKILWDDVPAAYPYFFNYLSGHDDSVQRRAGHRTRPQHPERRQQGLIPVRDRRRSSAPGRAPTTMAHTKDHMLRFAIRRAALASSRCSS